MPALKHDPLRDDPDVQGHTTTGDTVIVHLADHTTGKADVLLLADLTRIEPRDGDGHRLHLQLRENGFKHGAALDGYTPGDTAHINTARSRPDGFNFTVYSEDRFWQEHA